MLGNILAVGLMSMGMGLSGVKDEPKMYAQDEGTYTITYNDEDWEEKAQSVYDWLLENNYTDQNKLTITGSITNYPTFNPTTIYTYSNRVMLGNASNQNISYLMEDEVWHDHINGDVFTLESLSITSQTYYEANHEEPPSMGNSIIGSIASGLGIIGALATTFLTGFGNLFYSSGALTPFAIFALVMLGVAVSFAVVKLVLNIIRSNTGA